MSILPYSISFCHDPCFAVFFLTYFAAMITVVDIPMASKAEFELGQILARISFRR